MSASQFPRQESDDPALTPILEQLVLQKVVEHTRAARELRRIEKKLATDVDRDPAKRQAFEQLLVEATRYESIYADAARETSLFVAMLKKILRRQRVGYQA